DTRRRPVPSREAGRRSRRSRHQLPLERVEHWTRPTLLVSSQPLRAPPCPGSRKSLLRARRRSGAPPLRPTSSLRVRAFSIFPWSRTGRTRPAHHWLPATHRHTDRRAPRVLLKRRSPSTLGRRAGITFAWEEPQLENVAS